MIVVKFLVIETEISNGSLKNYTKYMGHSLHSKNSSFSTKTGWKIFTVSDTPLFWIEVTLKRVTLQTL